MSKYIPGNQKHLILEDRIYIENELNKRKRLILGQIPYGRQIIYYDWQETQAKRKRFTLYKKSQSLWNENSSEKMSRSDSSWSVAKAVSPIINGAENGISSLELFITESASFVKAAILFRIRRANLLELLLFRKQLSWMWQNRKYLVM